MRARARARAHWSAGVRLARVVACGRASPATTCLDALAIRTSSSACALFRPALTVATAQRAASMIPSSSGGAGEGQPTHAGASGSLVVHTPLLASGAKNSSTRVLSVSTGAHVSPGAQRPSRSHGPPHDSPAARPVGGHAICPSSPHGGHRAADAKIGSVSRRRWMAIRDIGAEKRCQDKQLLRLLRTLRVRTEGGEEAESRASPKSDTANARSERMARLSHTLP